MKALVTGINGFSGSNLANYLLKDYWEVVGTDLADVSKVPCEYHKADLTKRKTLGSLMKDVDVVFHPAAIFDYSASLEKLMNVNVGGTKNLLDEATQQGVEKVVVWSSVAVYGEANPKWYSIPIHENQALNPSIEGKYDLSKRAQESVAQLYNLDISIIRPGPLYGPGSWYGMYDLFKLLKFGILPAVPTSLHKVKLPLIHVDDVSRAAIHLAENPSSGTYNVVDDNTLDMLDTLRYVAGLTDHKLKTMLPMSLKPFKPVFKLFGKWSEWEAKHLRKGKRPKIETDTLSYMFGNYYFSNEKLKNTGFEFKYPDRRVGLLETVKWYDSVGWRL